MSSKGLGRLSGPGQFFKFKALSASDVVGPSFSVQVLDYRERVILPTLVTVTLESV